MMTTSRSSPSSALMQSLPPLNQSDKENTSSRNRTLSPAFTVPKTGCTKLIASPASRRFLLRPGETAESLFGFTPEDNSDYARCCRLVAQGVGETADQWGCILKQATERTPSCMSGSALIRLHRRATSRFADPIPEEADQVAGMWLSFVQALSLHGPEKDARILFRHLKSQGLCKNRAELYLALSSMEERLGDPSAAKTILQDGIDREASPAEKLRVKLKLIGGSAIPKRRKLQDISLANDEADKRDEDVSAVKIKKESVRFQIAPPPLSNSSKAISIPTKPLPPRPDKTQNEKPAPRDLVVSSSRVSQKNVDSKTKRTSLLSSKLKAQARTVLGKPTRLNPVLASADPESDEDETTVDIHEALHTSEQSSKKPKIPKMDLGYMLAWDPNKRLATKSPARDDAQTSLPSTGSVSIHTSFSGETDLGYQDQNLSSHNHATGKEEPMAADCSTDFLSLIHKNNILRVNQTPFIRLGVIGRGGSCKVYRGLSRQGDVVAIKKVKLDGMDERSIAGYSNEIALLKRLRGNPSIIRLLDSQVNMDRKAIFLVMEVGEVDLNHVLDQNGIKGESQQRRALNMNFVRLTWQQMLTAVHSIHEERIIHGDLKPANFLFVRGALKLIDFGIAKAIQSDDTTNVYRETLIGTVNYMSPEALQADQGASTDGAATMKVGRASDIWSLGCILYQMVYGKTPFAHIKNMFTKLQAIIDERHQISFPSVVESAAIDAIRCCLRRDPCKRAPIVGASGLLNEHPFLKIKH